jgi:cytochrome c oxidase subunit II
VKRGALFATSVLAGVFAGGAASAATGAPTPKGVEFQTPATAIMREIVAFDNLLLLLITAISVFVLLLLLWVVVRYNRRANPTPQKFTHNLFIELVWTIVPVLILVFVAARSFPLLFEEERIHPAEVTLKVTGNSWFWNFEYPDLGVTIAANLLPEDEARAEGRPYLLATTEPLLVPVGENVRVLVTSNDVIHAFAVPAFGVKEDAIQGRVNETWFNVEEPGTYYGQCSELCGINHGYMPIEIRAVSREEFNQWVVAQGGAIAEAPAEAPVAPAATPTR